ncbi:kinase-like protein [Polyplosphaeria fusca]|uniref:Kinase-like protein n=1 Tax=Polyplosphaeria fusca TaxID=682080 RepID=A0A9P4RAV3_9PLEO|nr:kinase-like protein [Polyplosphaeria fusca]
MASMFRRPGEDSSSSSESDENTNMTDELNLLSRINTLDSTTSGRQSARPTPSITRNNSHIRDLVLHSLLEDKAVQEAATHLGKRPSDPDVQALANNTYRELSRQLAGSGAADMDERYASESMRPARTAAQRGISEAIARAHLPQLTPQATPGAQGALVPVASATQLPSLFAKVPREIELPLQNYPGLHTDRYAREFIELDMIGNGGYGKVYKVKHKLDNSFYAIKRIMVSEARLQKIQDHGPKEMESMLEEVRALARFDHGNIVRYHNCWLEFTTAQTDAQPSLLRKNMLIENGLSQTASSEGVEGLQAGFSGISFEDPFEASVDDAGAGIVFEDSNGSHGEVNASPQRGGNLLEDDIETPKRRPRGNSQTTITTISSTRSHMSAIESVGEDDDEVEMIPRSHLPESQSLTSDVSQSMVSHSDAPAPLVPNPPISGPILTLNIQMSLYDTNLAAFLSPDQPSFTAHPHLHHCFHPRIALSLLAEIIAGVEYLHAHSVVHRDLKPANIFLSLSASRIPPSGSVDLSTCSSCPKAERLHITPRIGDFGLVAALGDGCMAPGAVAKPVGTEFYRPEQGGAISEKLDVFALGVVGFEMLQRFDTRMERVHALMDLRRGVFPGDFLKGVGEEEGAGIRGVIGGMVCADEGGRASCEEVRCGIKGVVARLGDRI